MAGLQVLAPGTTTAQRANGAAAAQAVLKASGVDPAVAFSAHRQLEEVRLKDLETELPPALVRASVIWGRAVQAALLACYGFAATVPFQLVVDL